MLKHFRLDVLLVYFWRDLPTVPCQNNRMKIPFYFVIFKEVCQGLLKGRSLLHLKSHKAMMTFRVSNPRTLFLWCICFISFYSGSKCVFKLGTEALMGISWQSFIWFNWCKNNRSPEVNKPKRWTQKVEYLKCFFHWQSFVDLIIFRLKERRNLQYLVSGF